MVLATDLFHMMDDPGGPSHVNFDEPVATFDARYVISGAAAPVGAQYVVLALDATLTDERVLTGTANQIAIADGGAGGNVTLSTPQDIHTAATPEFDGVVIGSADGINCNPGADIDTDLISVGVTGNPLLKWDESENAFDFSTSIALPTTTSTVGQIIQNSNRFVHSYGTDNLFFGSLAGNVTLTGQSLIGIGAGALAAETSGSYNVAIGKDALALNQDGAYNLAIGDRALDANVSADYCIAIGYGALGAHTAGTCLAIGSGALALNTTGTANLAIGTNALRACLTGTENVAIGAGALDDLTTGYRNFAIGTGAMAKVTTAYDGVAIGVNAMGRTTTGQYNLAIGTFALFRNQTGQRNVAIGFHAGGGFHATPNNLNHIVAIGMSAGSQLTTGSYNILIGFQAGDVLTTGVRNIIIGYDIDPSANNASNELNIGGVIFGTLTANQNITINALTVSADYDLMLAGDGVLGLKETATPNADANYGKVYCKNDDKLYFQDGAGAEHEIAFV